MQQLPAVQLAQDLEEARDLAPDDGLRPALARALQEGAEVAVARVLQRQAVEDVPVPVQQREGVEDADGPHVAVQQLAEVGLAHPAVDALAGLDADRRRDAGQDPPAPRQVRLPETTLAQEASDPVAQARLRAADDLAVGQETMRRLERDGRGPRPRGGGRDAAERGGGRRHAGGRTGPA